MTAKDFLFSKINNYTSLHPVHRLSIDREDLENWLDEYGKMCFEAAREGKLTKSYNGDDNRPMAFIETYRNFQHFKDSKEGK